MFNFTEVISPLCGGQPSCLFPLICVRPYGFSDPEVCLHYSVKYMNFTTGVCETGSSTAVLPSSISQATILASTVAPVVSQASSNTFLIEFTLLMIMLLLLGLSVIAFITFFRRQNLPPHVQSVHYLNSPPRVQTVRSPQISVIRDSGTFFKASAAGPAVPAAKTVASN